MTERTQEADLNPSSLLSSSHAGINVRKGTLTDMLEEKVVQPLLVTSSALSLATECVRMILKIDDVVPVR